MMCGVTRNSKTAEAKPDYNFVFLLAISAKFQASTLVFRYVNFNNMTLQLQLHKKCTPSTAGQTWESFTHAPDH